MAVMPSPGIRVIAAEFQIRDLGRISEWCDLCGMKSIASKTKTMIVSRSRTMRDLELAGYQSPLTISGTVLEQSDDLVILGVTFDSTMTFKKHIRSVFRAASQRLGILRKYLRVFHDRSLLGGCFRVLSCPFWSTDLQCGARLPIHTLNFWTVYNQWCPFSNWGCV